MNDDPTVLAAWTSIEVDGCDTISKLFQERCERYGARVAHREKALGIWQSYSWSNYYDEARKVGLGLAELGFQRGNTVSVLSEDRREWLYCDMGVVAMGGITNGIYTTDSAKQLAYLIGDSDSRFLFVENDEQLDKYLEVKDEMPTWTR